MKTVYVDIKENFSKWKKRRIIKKLCKINKKENIVIALSKETKKNEEFKNEIKKFNMKILDGKWLFKFLFCDIIEYISKMKSSKIETQIVAILIERQDEIVLAELYEIAKRVKSLKIVSKYIDKFDYIEERLYEEEGIAIQITNNKKKSLSNVDIIINFDYNEKSLSEYDINELAVLVNIEEDIKNFKGTNISDYKIEYNKENFEKVSNELDFDSNIIYESYIYRKDTWQNIKKQLKQDEVRLVGLFESDKKQYFEKVLDKPKILA